MATKKTTKKAKPRHLYRNAAASPVPRAVVVRPQRPTSQDNEETPGWTLIKAAGGALGGAVLGGLLARQDWAPPKVMGGAIALVGAALALEGPPKLKSLAIGAMSAGTGQLGLLFLDDQYDKPAEDKDKKEQVSSKSAPPASGKRQASDIPQDALARAYERARLRMAMTSEPSN
jgi:hypothetical protein